jgi:O-succinylbenzoate synthase
MEKQKRTGWGEFEELFATEVIAQAQRNARKWFMAWAVTAIALVVSNVLWAVR